MGRREGDPSRKKRGSVYSARLRKEAFEAVVASALRIFTVRAPCHNPTLRRSRKTAAYSLAVQKR